MLIVNAGQHQFRDDSGYLAGSPPTRRPDAAPAELLRLASVLDIAGPVSRALDVATAE